eukprot:PLAT9780.1.p1 GENE.PLAT9780.1~~PLAT9780.1.p1  ORF type:complete len:685 (-),score=455.50 PLAT9780.1:89-2143(-)
MSVSAEQLKFIVRRLRAEPFEMELSLVTLDEKSAVGLLVMLNDVFAALDERHAEVDVRSEEPELREARWLEFLSVLAYSFPPDMERFRDELNAGDKSAVLPVIAWILENWDTCKKRAYLAPFLFRIDVPADFRGDDAVMREMARYEAAMEEFKAADAAVDAMSESPSDSSGLRARLEQLESERKRLRSKIAEMKRKTEDEEEEDGRFEELLRVTTALRLQQEDQAELMERLDVQRRELLESERRSEMMDEQLAELRRSSGPSATAEELLTALRAEVTAKRAYLQGELPEQIVSQRERATKLTAILRGPARSEEDVMELRELLEEELAAQERMQAEVEEAERRTKDDKLSWQRKQVAAMAAKLDAADVALRRAATEARDLDAELREREDEVRAMDGDSGIDRRKLADEVASMGTKYARMRTTLAALAAENMTLSRTEQLLSGRCEGLDALLEQMERNRGISGYTKTEDELVAVTAKKAKVDEDKGRTLEEIAEVVSQLNVKIKSWKHELAAPIQELRRLRAVFTEVESRYTDKKGAYEAVAAGLESEKLALEAEAVAAQEDCLREEGRYHFLNTLSSIADSHLERLEMEKRFDRGDGELLPEFPTFRALYEDRVSFLKKEADKLSDRKRDLVENENDYLEQVYMFADLRRLLNAKLKTTKAAPADIEAEAAGEVDIDGAAEIWSF